MFVRFAPRALVALSLLTSTVLLAPAADRTEGKMFATRSVSYAANGMVSAAHPLAAQAGNEILRKGGNAIDAAIATNAALAFLEPVACGLGGDMYAILWDAESKQLYGLNGSGRAPAALTIDKVPAQADGTIPLFSPYAWTVPGAVDGWVTLHERFGKLPLSEVLEPAARLAESGAPVPQVIAGSWARSKRRFADKPGFADVFLPGGEAPREGEIFKNPALAKTLRLIGKEGRKAFYDGPIAKAIVEFSDENGGFFSMEDFRTHTSEWIDPVSASYGGYEMWELPPNGQGIAALQMLNILEELDIGSMPWGSTDYLHALVESKKLAFADRARFYADTAMADVPVAGLISKPYAKKRAALVDMKRAAKHVEPGNPNLEHGDTTYLATGDREGNLVSLINSNYTGFGSGYAVPAVGIGIQNRGALFSLDPEHPNALEPGKRPFHTIIPAFITKQGTPWCAYGIMGGATQPQQHVQVFLNMVEYGMNIQEAGDAPRFVHTGSAQPTGLEMTDGGWLHLESGYDDEVRRALARRGHRLRPALGIFGGYQAVCRDPVTGVLAGATESRKDGMALGH